MMGIIGKSRSFPLISVHLSRTLGQVVAVNGGGLAGFGGDIGGFGGRVSGFGTWALGWLAGYGIAGPAGLLGDEPTIELACQ